MPNYCDPETGICTPSSLAELQAIGTEAHDHMEIIYVGDPMCSWCWGISPELIKLRDHFIPQQLAYRVVVGGLRPGGGDPWDQGMKDFLKHHWEDVHKRSGQPFSYDLFNLDSFEYDTEPACRAVVAARPMVGHREMEFFEDIQRGFYANSLDPKEEIFYEPICAKHEIDYKQFLGRFNSEDVKKETQEEFLLNRRWGVSGYPTVVLLNKDKLHLIAHGYAGFDAMRSNVEQALAM